MAHEALKAELEERLAAMEAVAKAGKESQITLTTKTEVKKGKKKIDIAELVGKKVKVVSEHKKADSVTG